MLLNFIILCACELMLGIAVWYQIRNGDFIWSLFNMFFMGMLANAIYRAGVGL